MISLKATKMANNGAKITSSTLWVFTSQHKWFSTHKAYHNSYPLLGTEYLLIEMSE
jgi:hypothetical protein